ncbi:hypothetical protein GLAREA_02000 [Glarea lozoyensis ATCC 20868]|uniref:Uncharacterized protein n=1 Tax=Glarea lozoyensis (strain ATCC 20868 / MF5171) TaxID=1116229 RepID=S3DHN0_GLAL2|nr:uncharacterized protein GLAREA_02000 [Glarea lozoyensis ATCC 20868]EPE26088.1 hypothetical protein GLAREA_02000 [Glarea lozoyensis ATCC 20868]
MDTSQKRRHMKGKERAAKDNGSQRHTPSTLSSYNFTSTAPPPPPHHSQRASTIHSNRPPESAPPYGRVRTLEAFLPLTCFARGSTVLVPSSPSLVFEEPSIDTERPSERSFERSVLYLHT